MMIGTSLVGYALCVVLIALIMWSTVRVRPAQRAVLAPSVRLLLAAARWIAVAAVLASAVLVVAQFVSGYFLRDLAGLPFALAPALGTAAGLLLYSVTPPRVVPLESDVPREASLIPRTVRSYIPRLGTPIVAVIVVAQTLFLVFTGVTASPDESGRYRVIAFQAAGFATSASPYTGWFYAVPLFAATVIILAATAIALWRVSPTPALPLAEFADVDAGWRRAVTRIIVALSAASLLLQFGGAGIISGAAIRDAHFAGVPVGWELLGHAFQGGGLLMLTGSVTTVALATRWALTLPRLALGDALRRRVPPDDATHEQIVP